MRTSSGSHDSDSLPAGILLFHLEWRDGPPDQENIELTLELTHEFSQQYDLMILLFSLGMVREEQHLLSSLFHALRAEARGTSRTRDLSMDVLRYAAGERQIREAIWTTGLNTTDEQCGCMAYIPEASEKNIPLIRDTVVAFLHGVGFEINDTKEFSRDGLMNALERTALVDLKL